MKIFLFVLPATIFLFSCKKDRADLYSLKNEDAQLSSLKKDSSTLLDTGNVQQQMLIYTPQQLLELSPSWGETTGNGSLSWSGYTLRKSKTWNVVKCLYGVWLVTSTVYCTGDYQTGTFLTSEHMGSHLSGLTFDVAEWKETKGITTIDQDKKTTYNIVTGYVHVTGAGATPEITRSKGYNFQALFLSQD